MDLDAHGHLFCSVLQFRSWYKLRCGLFEVADRIEDDEDTADTRREKTVAYEVEKKQLYNARVQCLTTRTPSDAADAYVNRGQRHSFLVKGSSFVWHALVR